MPAYIFLIVLLALVWLLLIRPRQRAMKQQKQQLQGVAVGDEILTAGGLYGFVRRIDGDELQVELAPGLEVRMARRAVAAILTAGGLYGFVRGIDGDELRVELAPGLEVRMARRAVAAVLTEKQAELETPAEVEPAEAQEEQAGANLPEG